MGESRAVTPGIRASSVAVTTHIQEGIMARGIIAAGAPDVRLEDARRDFENARTAFEEAREHLLRTHVETSRLWVTAS